MPDNRPLFSAPAAAGTTTASRPARATHRTTATLRLPELLVDGAGEEGRRANPGDELTVDPADRRRRARAALLDLRRDVIRRDLQGR